MEKEESQSWVQGLINGSASTDQEAVAHFLQTYPFVSSVRTWQTFQQVRSGKIKLDQAREALALFSPFTFNLPFVYENWVTSLDTNEPVLSESEKVEEEAVVYEDISTLPDEPSPEAEQSAAAKDAKPSKYHDEVMPFSFLWWLNKTRIEFADTYQPYSTSTEDKVGGHTDSDWIDQQIKEHIFHMQSPEALLSDSAKKQTVSFELNKKADPVIEKFIKEEPQIKPPSATKINLENKARQSAEDESGFVSETLAKIYTEQGLYVKAIDTYKKLSLKFPEKSPYFARLIEKLNKKIN